MSITIIGDVHGKIDKYQEILRGLPPGQNSIQLGDMLVGFPGVKLGRLPLEHRWFRGNHDNPALSRKHPNYIGDAGGRKIWDIFWLAGASSIDREGRTEGKDWWRDEELSYAELDAAFTMYVRQKPRFVVTHDAPRRAAQHLLHSLLVGYVPEHDTHSSRTSEALQQMYEAHQPEVWVFGHYHIDKEFQIDDRTKFRCVGELSTYDLG